MNNSNVNENISLAQFDLRVLPNQGYGTDYYELSYSGLIFTLVLRRKLRYMNCSNTLGEMQLGRCDRKMLPSILALLQNFEDAKQYLPWNRAGKAKCQEMSSVHSTYSEDIVQGNEPAIYNRVGRSRDSRDVLSWEKQRW